MKQQDAGGDAWGRLKLLYVPLESSGLHKPTVRPVRPAVSVVIPLQTLRHAGCLCIVLSCHHTGQLNHPRHRLCAGMRQWDIGSAHLVSQRLRGWVGLGRGVKQQGRYTRKA